MAKARVVLLSAEPQRRSRFAVTARIILCTLFVIFGFGLAGCGTMASGSGASAFEDCYNRPPLYQQEHGCYERQ